MSAIWNKSLREFLSHSSDGTPCLWEAEDLARWCASMWAGHTPHTYVVVPWDEQARRIHAGGGL